MYSPEMSFLFISLTFVLYRLFFLNRYKTQGTCVLCIRTQCVFKQVFCIFPNSDFCTSNAGMLTGSLTGKLFQRSLGMLNSKASSFSTSSPSAAPSGKLSGKVAIVTASTDGIGLGIAENLAKHGAHVMLSSRKVCAPFTIL